MESAHAWQVDNPDEAFALLGRQLPAGQEPRVHSPCHSYVEQGAVYGDQLAFLYIAPSAEADRWCEPTDRKYSERRPVAGELPELDDDQGWLVVVDTKKIVDEVIGCTHWSVIFCENPFGDELAWGEPAA